MELHAAWLAAPVQGSVQGSVTQVRVRNQLISSLPVLWGFLPDLFLYFWSPPGSWLWWKNDFLYDPFCWTLWTRSYCSLCKSHYLGNGSQVALLVLIPVWFCPSELHHWATGQESASKRRLFYHGLIASCYHRDSLTTGKETLLMADYSISNFCSHAGLRYWERKVRLRNTKITSVLTAYPLGGKYPKNQACL